MLNRRADKLELLRIAEAVALEKSIDKELIITSMETGIAKAARSKFGSEKEIVVNINRDNGDIEIYRKLVISDKPENPNIIPLWIDAIVFFPITFMGSFKDTLGNLAVFLYNEFIDVLRPGTIDTPRISPLFDIEVNVKAVPKSTIIIFNSNILL